MNKNWPYLRQIESSSMFGVDDIDIDKYFKSYPLDGSMLLLVDFN